MATYAIGDVQGCYATLQRLLARIKFNPHHDTVWLAGDLVNRGPDSLSVLRWARDMGERVVAVLGNHDLRLLSIAHGVKELRPSDTLTPILEAPDRDALVAWLQARPLVHRQGQHLMLHAGVVPSWDINAIEAHGRAVQDALASAQAVPLLASMSALRADTWTPDLTGFERLALITKILTYMRVCRADDHVYLDFTGAPADAPPGFAPWFTHANRRSRDVTIVCGHWSALGLHRGDGILALDTGCAWDKALTAVCLEDGTLYQEPASPFT